MTNIVVMLLNILHVFKMVTLQGVLLYGTIPLRDKKVNTLIYVRGV